MLDAIRTAPTDGIGIALVDGAAAVRHERQLMLHSEGFTVRSYATCAALLADPGSRDCRCLILDLGMADIDGPALLHALRTTGWRGKALLLGDSTADGAVRRAAGQHGDIALPRSTGDRALLTAIAAAIAP